ncbi:unnamed protein product [Paramecium pentaurelia]|uniref:60S ribosomal export protein NMD3 n=1 Tax=Paramecium pentaurelia TaxID=43138 RepID=A0A8S1VQI9_9CILI|nr:unnamed protein product [Paramecium pentaurelia]
MLQRAVLMFCPLCELEFEPKLTKTNICPNCLIAQMNITQDIDNDKEILFCRYCRRYQRPPWVLCERDSKELLAICLKKVIGLSEKTIIDTKFIFTEASTKQIKLQITVQKEAMNGTCIQDSKILNFEEVYHQCEDCKREFTPHIWGACIQLRQRVNHKKSFYYLEQLILQHHMNQQMLKVESADDGMNFYYKQKNQALHMLEFIRSYLPIQVKESKEVFSFIKYTFVVDVQRICKDDLVILPHKLCHQLGGINRVQICYRVASSIQLIDPIKLKVCEISAEQYFKHDLDIRTMPLRENCDEFTVLDVEKIKPQKNDQNNPFQNSLCSVELMKDNDSDYKQYQVKSHLGNFLQAGMTVQGFDLNKYNNELDEIYDKPELIIIRRKPEKNKKRKTQLKRLDIEENQEKRNKKKEGLEEQQIEEFLEDIEQDQHLQETLNLQQVQSQQ